MARSGGSSDRRSSGSFFCGFSSSSRSRCCPAVLGHASPADEKCRLREARVLREDRGPLFALPAEGELGRRLFGELDLFLNAGVAVCSVLCFFFFFFVVVILPEPPAAADPGRLSLCSLPERGRAREGRVQGPRGDFSVFVSVPDAAGPLCRRRRRRPSPARRRSVRLGGGGGLPGGRGEEEQGRGERRRRRSRGRPAPSSSSFPSEDRVRGGLGGPAGEGPPRRGRRRRRAQGGRLRLFRARRGGGNDDNGRCGRF